MSDYTLTIPEEVYKRAQAIAEETSQPVDRVITDYLRTLSAPLPVLPPEEEAELIALKSLSDDALWTIAREQLPQSIQTVMQNLMDKNSLGRITPDEYQELEALVDRAQRLMVRKSEATALLTDRGYNVTPGDLKSSEWVVAEGNPTTGL